MKDKLKHSMNLYYKMMQGMADYYQDYARIMEKSFTEIQNIGVHRDKEGTFPVNGHDIYNYVARYNMSNLQIQAIMKLDGKLDFDKLKLAVKLSIEEEPVLGCRFIEADKPYWKPLENPGMVKFCTLEETDDIDKAVHRFIRSSVDIDNAPMVNIRLIRSKEYDVLGLKINHACCDGVGAQEYLHLLAEIYTSIDGENGTFIPKPRIAGRTDQDRLFQELGITDPDSIFIPGSDVYTPTWPFPWEQGGSNIPSMSICRLPAGHLDAISKFAKSKGSTVNDYILAAFYRAMQQMGTPIYGSPMELPITVDLRRYLPDHKTTAIRNFSVSVNTKLTMIQSEPFSRTMQRVTAVMKGLKMGYPGLQSVLGLERVERINFKETLAYYQAAGDPSKAQFYCPLFCGDKCVPTLSNVGYLSKALIKFGRNTVVDAFILPPVIRAPGLLLMASSYNSVLTLAVGYYKNTICREEMDKFFNKMKIELVKGYKNPSDII
jgi:NRPS condensation-like uncharacterized protein